MPEEWTIEFEDDRELIVTEDGLTLDGTTVLWGSVLDFVAWAVNQPDARALSA